ncbi:hypothetical protein METP3_03644 [Methanosarcinales archaeon]|nr:hypothetical protein METP3_03644 [Methanosarcinales archaeon]
MSDRRYGPHSRDSVVKYAKLASGPVYSQVVEIMALRSNSESIDDYGSVSMEQASNTVGKLFFWALMAQLIINFFKYILYGIKGAGETIWNSIVKVFGKIYDWQKEI